MFRPLFILCYILSARLWPALRFKLRLECKPSKIDGPALVLAKHVSYWDIPMVSRGVHRVCPGQFPHFEMASFHGYPLLQNLTWFLEANGGFPVMRPKDLIRLKRKGEGSKEELVELMTAVNEKAAATRKGIYSQKKVVCYFPEGTRHNERVLPLRSLHEIDEALGYGKDEGTAVTMLPILPCYGRKPSSFFRRRKVIVRVLDPIDTEGRSAEEVLAEAQALFQAHWLPPDAVEKSFLA